MGLIDWMMFNVPYFEVLVRRLYYFRKDHYHPRHKDSKVHHKRKDIVNKFDKKKVFIKQLQNLDIQKGDLIIVHSSMDELSLYGLSPIEIVDLIIELVGADGTVAFPAYPDYSKQDYSKQGYYVYDVKKSISWTGAIPNIVCRNKDAVRSECPCNPLVFVGKKAKELTKNNLDASFAHGENSAWLRCVDSHAKILFLGCSPMHSNTVQHVVEDIMGDEWPIRDWHEDKKYLVKLNDRITIITIHERKQFWARYINEHRNFKRMIKDGFIHDYSIFDTPLFLINDSKLLVNYLAERAKKGKLDYLIPRRFWR